MLAWAAAAVLAACGGSSYAPASSAPPASEPPPVAADPALRQTSAGALQGVDDSARSGTYFWKGVPYAQAPTGALRWRAPAAPKAWSDVRDAKRFASACLQIGRMFGPGANNTYDATIGTTMGQPVGSEDCLYLNIWRPASEEKNLPVLVFVHGGSNISGYTADPLYDGANLAKAANAVVVTVNYRLGILGFLNMPQLAQADREESGNFALLDIAAALKFVQSDIAGFGGNPANVTLSGESAGAVNLLAMMSSSRNAGLFHKAIEMSGGVSIASNLPPATVPALSPASASLAQGQGILASLLVADGTAADAGAAKTYIATQTPAQIADYLRGKDGNALLKVVLAAGLNAANPIPDGKVVPVDPIGTLAAGQGLNVPLMAGTMKEEGKLFASLLPSLSPAFKPGWIVDDATRFSMMFDNDPNAPSAVAIGDIVDASYLPVDTPVTGFNAATGLITAALFEANRNNLLNTLAPRQAKLWSYRFDWAQQPAPWNDVYGAAHAFDLPFLFGNFGPSVISGVAFGKANEAGRVALSKAFMASVAAFLRTGDPNTAALGASWAPWPASLHLDASPSTAKITAQ
ncbi:MAG: carboxylesterase family protein [Proteobacteria bacterium]|nr:carboxylesterase family protein [Pseudomonadota bacterium]